MSIVANSTVSKKCIICLQCATSMVPLDTTVDIDGVPTSCEIMYSKFTGLQYDPTTLTDEHLSLKLCLACLTQLNSCYLFQRQAIDNFYECFILSYEKLSTEEEASSHHEGNQQTNKLAEICPEFEDDDAVWEDDKKYYDENFVVNNQSPSPEAESFEAVELETETEEVEERHHEEDTGSQNEKAVAENESKQPATSSCVECSKLADQPVSFRQHFLRAHCVVKARHQHQCTVCAQCFKTKGSFLRHIRVHTGIRQYACQYCPKSFYYLHHLQLHERTHTHERPFVCSKCAKAFPSNDRLLAHERTHQQAHLYECTLCHKRYKTRLYLHRHKLIKHDRPVAKFQPCRCERCGKMLLSQSALTYHTQLACGGAVGQHPSSKQVDGTAEETTLSSSDSGGTMNTKLNRHRCDVCGLHFKQRIALTRHRLRHDGIRPFRCAICDSAFTQKGTLKTHMRTHTDEKPFQCADCSECFRSAAARRSHRLRQRCPGQQLA